MATLSDHVRQHGIAPFTVEDFDFVGSKVTTDPKRLILVGGQAIEVWGHVFSVDPPMGNGQPLTEDTDWLGSSRDARWLCALLGRDVDLQLPGESDHGPSTGLAYLKRPDGRVLMMDFLRCIIGPSNEEIRRLAVLIEVRGVRLHVLHPLLCVHSRLANLSALSSKRRSNGPMQAQWAVDISSAYIERFASTAENQRDAIRACHKLEELAMSPAGRYCYLSFNIDPLRAVTGQIVQAIGGRFALDDWPRVLRRVDQRRAKWRGQMARHAAR